MAKKSWRVISILAGMAALILLILYTGGFLDTGKVPPGKEQVAEGAYQPKAQAEATLAVWPDFYEAVGTVRPRTETKVEAQVSGRVKEVNVRPGDMVKEGKLLVLLDDSEHRARLGQAKQDLNAAQAAWKLAESEYGRIKRLYDRGSAPKRDLDRLAEGRQRTSAMLRRAEKQVEEAEIALGYTRITARENGQITERFIDPGDMALPGRPLLVMQTGGALRLEALVQEKLIQKVHIGQELSVAIPALGREIPGRVDEIVPSADPATRTFLVKVVLPDVEGLYTGMFGRLLIPVGEQEVILIPTAALKRVGQLEMAVVNREGHWQRVYVTTGRQRGDMLEVLSGLKGGETVALEAGQND